MTAAIAPAGRDPEASGFQRRPAYRYIRATDHLPSVDEALAAGLSAAVHIKLFDPTGSGTWYITGYDPGTRIATGAARIWELEAGDFAMPELVAIRCRFGLPLERDLYWTPCPLGTVLDGLRR